MNTKGILEVEFRCRFNSVDEAYKVLPFLQPGLQRSCTWTTTIYGLELFHSGQLIRTAEIIIGNDHRSFIGWKGPDTGKFANIRLELDEEITQESTDSYVLMALGGRGNLSSLNGAIRELERLGHHPFMSFEGVDFIGYNELYDIKLKLMTCTKLKWPLLVEIEKTADSEEGASRCENELQELCRQFHLEERTAREEPPTLLYESIFGKKP